MFRSCVSTDQRAPSHVETNDTLVIHFNLFPCLKRSKVWRNERLIISLVLVSTRYSDNQESNATTIFLIKRRKEKKFSIFDDFSNFENEKFDWIERMKYLTILWERNLIIVPFNKYFKDVSTNIITSLFPKKIFPAY